MTRGWVMTETEGRLAHEIRTLAEAGPGPFAEIAHELRTPLTIIAGYVEMLLEDKAGPLTPAQQAMLATVDRNLARLWRLVEDVLDAASIESHPFRTTRSPVSLTSLAAAAVAAVQPRAAAGGVTVNACPRGSLTVRGDPVQLGGLLDRLLASAVTGAPAGSHVELSAARDDGAAVLEVTTTPPVPPPPRPAHVPRPSHAARVSLAICRTIAANHGGELESGASSVTVRLPVTGGAPGADREPRRLP